MPVSFSISCRVEGEEGLNAEEVLELVDKDAISNSSGEAEWDDYKQALCNLSPETAWIEDEAGQEVI